MTTLPTIIIRHKKENLKKCSLRGLEERDDFRFISYPCKELPLLNNYIILTPEAQPLSSDENHFGLCLIDATWKYARDMMRGLNLEKHPLCRSLPQTLRTAYPRRQTGCQNPETGLASIEALYAAFTILGKNTEGLLDHYYWTSSFFEKNPSFTKTTKESH